MTSPLIQWRMSAMNRATRGELPRISNSAVIHALNRHYANSVEKMWIGRRLRATLCCAIGAGPTQGARTVALVRPSGSAAAPAEMRTAPLWGLRVRGPFLHDGRAATVDVAIRLHDGEAATARTRYLQLPPAMQTQLLQFLFSI